MFKFESIEDRIKSSGGFTTGFDYLRIVLAIGVLVVHSVPLSYGGDSRWSFFPAWLLPFTLLIVPMFFTLSGFLVAGSFERTDLKTFVAFRVLRIFPALVVEVVFSALVLGPILTTLPWSEYFSHPVFLAYFSNIRGVIHYYLPGLFLDNPIKGVVNGSLWTVPHELICYLVLTLFGVYLLARKAGHIQTVIALVGIAAFGYFYSLHLGLALLNEGKMLVLGFVCGVVFYRGRRYVPLSLPLFVISVALSAYMTNTAYELLAIVPITYATVYLGLLQPKLMKLLKSGDYSYGVYLYAYPIQQTVITLTPSSWHVWWVNSIISLVLVAGFAAFSWHYIEKPTLKLKKLVNRGKLAARDEQLVTSPGQLPPAAPSAIVDASSDVRRIGENA